MQKALQFNAHICIYSASYIQHTIPCNKNALLLFSEKKISLFLFSEEKIDLLKTAEQVTDVGVQGSQDSAKLSALSWFTSSTLTPPI